MASYFKNLPQCLFNSFQVVWGNVVQSLLQPFFCYCSNLIDDRDDRPARTLDGNEKRRASLGRREERNYNNRPPVLVNDVGTENQTGAGLLNR